MECINGQKHLHKIQHGLLPGGEAGCHVKPERVEVDDNYLDNWPVSRDLLIRRSAFHLPQIHSHLRLCIRLTDFLYIRDFPIRQSCDLFLSPFEEYLA